MTTLQIIWFCIIALFMVGYTVLAGVDLGLGMLLLLTKHEHDRKGIFSAISPYWDGNQVWLIALGALLFSVFPPVYAAVLSAFYPLVMITLFALIVRSVSIEFGIRTAGERSGDYWAFAVAVSSIVAVFLFGVLIGNVVRGLPSGGMFNIFAFLAGIVNLAMLATYGAAYLRWKMQGGLAEHAGKWLHAAQFAFLITLVVTILAADAWRPNLLKNYRLMPALWIVPSLSITAIVAISLWDRLKMYLAAFISSSFANITLLASAAIALFPVLVPARGDSAESLTIANSSSSPASLLAMLVITAICMPLVFLSLAWVYRLFGKITSFDHY